MSAAHFDLHARVTPPSSSHAAHAASDSRSAKVCSFLFAVPGAVSLCLRVADNAAATAPIPIGRYWPQRSGLLRRSGWSLTVSLLLDIGSSRQGIACL
jgi:hypothetical protein